MNLARYAYLLARMQPDERASIEQKTLYQEFSRKMYEWMLDDTKMEGILQKTPCLLERKTEYEQLSLF